MLDNQDFGLFLLARENGFEDFLVFGHRALQPPRIAKGDHARLENLAAEVFDH